uniref:Flavodoxin/nitric oxide synthase n=1 Tax=Solibacter usitatus (strain Ellin6076) TaxID=234267 RepID=Q01PG7_SOLUE
MSRLIALALLCASISLGASPVRILVAYYSETGNTEKMAGAIRDGAVSIEGASVTLRKVADVTDEEIRSADGIVLGSPVQWGNLSVGAKRFLDRVGEVLGKAGKTLGDGRTAGVFCTAGSPSNGQEMTRLGAIAAFLAMRFVVVGGVNDQDFGTLGPQSVGAAGLADARRFGERFARVTLRLRGAASR